MTTEPEGIFRQLRRNLPTIAVSAALSLALAHHARTADGVHVLMPLRMQPPTTHPTKNKEEPMTESTTQAAGEPPAPDTKARRKTVTKNEPAAPATLTALDRLQAAYETARAKLREANESLAAIAVALKEAAREDRQRRAEIESVRAGLAKLQSIKV